MRFGLKNASKVFACAGVLWAASAWATGAAPASESKTVELKDASGKSVGSVNVTQTAHGLLLQGQLKGLPAGTHAIHVHETGKCEAPSFKSAGGHFNPAHKQHGAKEPEGQHAGDLPNLVVPKSGELSFELLAPDLTLTPGPNSVLDEDGSSLVIHAQADDYKSQPAGNAGDRVACGVLAK